MPSSPEARRQQRADKIARGICPDCTNPVVPGKTKCEKHLAKAAASAKKDRDEAAAEGLCPRCKDELPVPGKVYGPKCAAYLNEKNLENQAKNPEKHRTAAREHFRRKVASKHKEQSGS
jgi:hypothetical protein